MNFENTFIVLLAADSTRDGTVKMTTPHSRQPKSKQPADYTTKTNSAEINLDSLSEVFSALLGVSILGGNILKRNCRRIFVLDGYAQRGL